MAHFADIPYATHHYQHEEHLSFFSMMLLVSVLVMAAVMLIVAFGVMQIPEEASAGDRVIRLSGGVRMNVPAGERM